MRHEIDYQKGLERFEDEISFLIEASSDEKAPAAITDIYDSGFVSRELSKKLHKNEGVSGQDLEIISVGTDFDHFKEIRMELKRNDPDNWLPYIAVELAPYDDSLLRQVRQQPVEDPLGLYRLPTGEVIAMAIQLLEVLEYLHLQCGRAYLDWKPEHIFWNGLKKRAKLIDWNVTTVLHNGAERAQNIREDIRLFCVAVLYIG